MFCHQLLPRNMTELRIWRSFGADPSPPPLQAVLEPRIYIYNSYCNVNISDFILDMVEVVSSTQRVDHNFLNITHCRATRSTIWQNERQYQST